MTDKKKLEEFKNLTPYVKDNLYYFLAFRICYNYDQNISDDLVLRIVDLSYECWMKDKNNVDIDCYAYYILEAIYDYGGKIEQIEEKDPEDIVELYTDEKSAKELLVYNTKDLEYCFTTINNEKYYSSNDGFFVLNEKGYKIKEPHPMEYAPETFFDLLKENQIKDISIGMHYNIRCIMKEEFSDEEYEQYKDGISSYKEYCENNHITSRVILDSVGSKEDIDLFDIDKEYSNANKLSKLQDLFKKTKKSGIENYVYVSSLNNGTDYYFDNTNDTHYVAIDKNGILKELNNKPYFLLNELHKSEDDFIYISKSELKRIKDNLKEDYEDLFNRGNKKRTNNYTMPSLKKFYDYIEKNSIDLFKRDIGVSFFVSTQVYQYEHLIERVKIAKEQKKLYKEEKEQEF